MERDKMIGYCKDCKRNMPMYFDMLEKEFHCRVCDAYIDFETCYICKKEDACILEYDHFDKHFFICGKCLAKKRRKENA
jgi:hypothetical protein